MSHLTIILIALGLSMDSMAVSISSGIYMNRFSFRQSLKIALVMGIFQGGMTLLGWLAGASFSSYIKEIDHWVAFILLGYLGGKMIYESLKQEKEAISSLSNKTLLTLAIATSIDALAVGIGFAFLETNIYIPAIIIAITTFLLSFLGISFGCRFSKAKKVNVEFFGGVILVAIGMKILLEHTVL
ncbi:manganese efflux pump MntP family protein [Odoribacter sp. OttesenSCG-928-G04]|nr:manganese efflux pump MntP family protein [Odoribacter sp. OttesenSCG-928-G04]